MYKWATGVGKVIGLLGSRQGEHQKPQAGQNGLWQRAALPCTQCKMTFFLNGCCAMRSMGKHIILSSEGKRLKSGQRYKQSRFANLSYSYKFLTLGGKNGIIGFPTGLECIGIE